LANLGGSLFQSFPTTGGFSRTALNDQLGAKTGLASIISASLIVLTLLFLTPLFYHLPKTILASVIMVAVFGLIDIREVRYLWRVDRKDFFLLVISFLATLLLGIENGILLGVLLSLVLTIYKSTYPHMAILGEMPDSGAYLNIARFPNAKEYENVLIVRLDAQLWFANTGYFIQRIKKMELKKLNLDYVILAGGAIHDIDSSSIYELKDLISGYQNRGITFIVTGINGPVRDKMKESGILNLIGKDKFYFNVADAMNDIRKKMS